MPRLLWMCECTYSFIQRKNRVRTMTFGFAFCSVLYGVGFNSVRVLAHFYFHVRVRVLIKLGFWSSSFLLGSGSFSSLNATFTIYVRQWWANPNRDSTWIATAYRLWQFDFTASRLELNACNSIGNRFEFIVIWFEIVNLWRIRSGSVAMRFLTRALACNRSLP